MEGSMSAPDYCCNSPRSRRAIYSKGAVDLIPTENLICDRNGAVDTAVRTKRNEAAYVNLEFLTGNGKSSSDTDVNNNINVKQITSRIETIHRKNSTDSTKNSGGVGASNKYFNGDSITINPVRIPSIFVPESLHTTSVNDILASGDSSSSNDYTNTSITDCNNNNHGTTSNVSNKPKRNNYVNVDMKSLLTKNTNKNKHNFSQYDDTQADGPSPIYHQMRMDRETLHTNDQNPYMNVAMGSSLTVDSLQAGRKTSSAPDVNYANIALDVNYAVFEGLQASAPVSPVSRTLPSGTDYSRLDVAATQAIGAVLLDHNKQRSKSESGKGMNVLKDLKEKAKRKKKKKKNK